VGATVWNWPNSAVPVGPLSLGAGRRPPIRARKRTLWDRERPRLCENSDLTSRTFDSAKFNDEIRSESNLRAPKVQCKNALSGTRGVFTQPRPEAEVDGCERRTFTAGGGPPPLTGTMSSRATPKMSPDVERKSGTVVHLTDLAACPSADSKGSVDADYDHEVGSRMKQHGSPQ